MTGPATGVTAVGVGWTRWGPALRGAGTVAAMDDQDRHSSQRSDDDSDNTPEPEPVRLDTGGPASVGSDSVDPGTTPAVPANSASGDSGSANGASGDRTSGDRTAGDSDPRSTAAAEGDRSVAGAGDPLASLEADIASVASALETIDRIVAEDRSGPGAAEEIASVVSPERFPVSVPTQQTP